MAKKGLACIRSYRIELNFFPIDGERYSSPPSGIDSSLPEYDGISVDGLFLMPGETNWNNAILQPAFHYRAYQEEVRRSWDGQDHDWLYPK